MGHAAASAGGALTRYVTVPLMLVGTGMVLAASNAEEMRSKFGVVFGEMEEDVRSWAETNSRAWRRSQVDLETFLAETQNMVVGMGATRAEGAELSKQMVQLTIDLASFNNVAEADAMKLLQSAMIGNHETAKSLGAVINENTLAMAMQEMGLGGNFKALDEVTKMQVRYQAILMQSTDALGDAERTSGSFANVIRGIKGTIKDLSVEFGDVLLPTVAKFGEIILRGAEWLRDLDDGTKIWIVRIGVAVGAVGPLLFVVGSLVIWTTKLGEALKVVNALKLTQFIRSKLLGGALASQTAATGAAAKAQWSLNAAMAANPIGLAITLMAGMILVVTTIVKKLEEWEGVNERVREGLIGVTYALLGPVGGLILLYRYFKNFKENMRRELDDLIRLINWVIEGLNRITGSNIEPIPIRVVGTGFGVDIKGIAGKSGGLEDEFNFTKIMQDMENVSREIDEKLNQPKDGPVSLDDYYARFEEMDGQFEGLTGTMDEVNSNLESILTRGITVEHVHRHEGELKVLGYGRDGRFLTEANELIITQLKDELRIETRR